MCGDEYVTQLDHGDVHAYVIHNAYQISNCTSYIQCYLSIIYQQSWNKVYFYLIETNPKSRLCALEHVVISQETKSVSGDLTFLFLFTRGASTRSIRKYHLGVCTGAHLSHPTRSVLEICGTVLMRHYHFNLFFSYISCSIWPWSTQ